MSSRMLLILFICDSIRNIQKSWPSRDMRICKSGWAGVNQLKVPYTKCLGNPSFKNSKAAFGLLTYENNDRSSLEIIPASRSPLN